MFYHTGLILGLVFTAIISSPASAQNALEGKVLYGINRQTGDLARYDFDSHHIKYISSVHNAQRDVMTGIDAAAYIPGHQNLFAFWNDPQDNQMRLLYVNLETAVGTPVGDDLGQSDITGAVAVWVRMTDDDDDRGHVDDDDDEDHDRGHADDDDHDDHDRGHGNDDDGYDEDNTGNSTGVNRNGMGHGAHANDGDDEDHDSDHASNDEEDDHDGDHASDDDDDDDDHARDDDDDHDDRVASLSDDYAWRIFAVQTRYSQNNDDDDHDRDHADDDDDEDHDRGHGNDDDGYDEDNTGNSTGVNRNGMEHGAHDDDGDEDHDRDHADDDDDHEDHDEGHNDDDDFDDDSDDDHGSSLENRFQLIQVDYREGETEQIMALERAYDGLASIDGQRFYATYNDQLYLIDTAARTEQMLGSTSHPDMMGLEFADDVLMGFENNGDQLLPINLLTGSPMGDAMLLDMYQLGTIIFTTAPMDPANLPDSYD